MGLESHDYAVQARPPPPQIQHQKTMIKVIFVGFIAVLFMSGNVRILWLLSIDTIRANEDISRFGPWK